MFPKICAIYLIRLTNTYVGDDIGQTNYFSIIHPAMIEAIVPPRKGSEKPIVDGRLTTSFMIAIECSLLTLETYEMGEIHMFAKPALS